jgi:hypothetical protein
MRGVMRTVDGSYRQFLLTTKRIKRYEKFIIFGPLSAALHRTVRAIDAYLNPCPPPPDPFWDPAPRSFNDKLFLD